VVFFFQAEDGIRDGHVTGVQTCALPILIRRHAVGHCLSKGAKLDSAGEYLYFPPGLLEGDKLHFTNYEGRKTYVRVVGVRKFRKIGRASCRERVEKSMVEGVENRRAIGV